MFLLPYFIAVIVILVVLIIAFFAYGFIATKIYKKYYRNIFGKKIYKIAEYNDYYLINRVPIKSADGTQVIIDHLLFGNKFIYCIKDKYFRGAIEGKIVDDKWIFYDEESKYQKSKFIDNEIKTNKIRLSKIVQVTDIESEMFVNVVVVNNDSIIDGVETDNTNIICHIKDLKKIIKKFESKEDVNPINQNQLQHVVHDIFDTLKINKENE